MTDDTKDVQDNEEENQDISGDVSENLEQREEEGDKEDSGVKFSKAQLQQLSSITGSILKRQLEENVLPFLNKEEALPVSYRENEGGESPLQQKNREFHEQILSGNVIEAVQGITSILESAKSNLTQKQKIDTDKAITTYSSQPFYKDIQPEMRNIAHKAVERGYPPGAAAEYAYFKARTEYSENRQSDDQEATSLSMIGSGRRSPETKEPKLPPEFKDAFERDKEKGLFKDEADYIACLSPKTRKAHGLE